MDKRVYKLNVKVSVNEKEELNSLVIKEEMSLSDVIRKAIRNTYDVTGFEPSFENSIFSFTARRKSIFD